MRVFWLIVLLALVMCRGHAMAGSDGTLRLAFYQPGIRDTNQADVRVTLQLWADEIGKARGMKAIASVYDDMALLTQEVKAGRINLVIAPCMELAEHFAPDELGSGFIGRHQGTGEGLVLIARAADGAHGLSDLRGRRVARLANDRLAQVFLETQCLRLARKSCDELFEVMEEKRDNYSIHKVFFGQADAALVSLSAYHAAGELNPQVRQKLRIIGEWPVTALIFGLMPLNIDADFRDRVLSTAMQVTNTPRGRQILELFRTDHMERVEASQMQPFWALAREYQERLKTRSTRKK